jgi:hypothetical protein
VQTTWSHTVRLVPRVPCEFQKLFASLWIPGDGELKEIDGRLVRSPTFSQVWHFDRKLRRMKLRQRTFIPVVHRGRQRC